MKILVLIALIFASHSDASSDKKYESLSARAPNMSAVQILNWDQFKTLPVEKKIEYFDVLRDFLNKQESKWPGRRISSLFFPVADAEDVSCPAYDKASPEVQHKLDLGGGKVCIKAGFLVCVTLSGACSSGDPEYMKKAAKYCTGDDVRKLPCAPPLFLKKDGSALCVDKKLSIKNKSVTQTCIDAQKDLKMTDEEYKKLINDNSAKFKSEYEELTNTIRNGYCSPRNGKKWSYDPQDCTKLNELLDKVAPSHLGTKAVLTKNGDGHAICNGSYKIDSGKEKVDAGLVQTGSAAGWLYSMTPPPPGWMATECDVFGRVSKVDGSENPTADDGPKDANYKTCYARVNNGQKETLHFEGTATNGEDSCKLHLSRYRDGKIDATSKCSVEHLDGYNFQLKNKTPALTLVGDNRDVGTVIIKGKGPIIYGVPNTGIPPTEAFYYLPATNDLKANAICFGRGQNIISAEPSTSAPEEPRTGVSRPPRDGRVDNIHSTGN